MTPFRTVCFFIALTIVGIALLPYLSVDLLPKSRTHQLHVSFTLPDSSPELVEKSATSVLESIFSQLPNLKRIKSTSGYNTGDIELHFDETADLDFLQFEAASMVRRAYPQLPKNISYPIVAQGSWNPHGYDNPFLVYDINAPLQTFHIREATEAIFANALSHIDGLSKISVSGSKQLQITITYDYAKCLAWEIDPNSINSLIQTGLKTSYNGLINTNKREQFFIITTPSVTDFSGIENLAFITKTGHPIKLKDFATIYIEEKKSDSYFRINGKNSVSLNISAREGENKMVLAKQVKDIIKKIAEKLPKGYELRLTADDTAFLTKELEKNYRRTSLSIAIIILFILLFYRSWKYLLALFLSLLVSLSITTIMAWVIGLNIHLYTIGGVVIAFGLMTDNAIVMIDYYHRIRNRKIILALIASTVSTLAAVSMVFFLPSQDRDNLDNFSKVIILSLISSLIVALWFIPGIYNILDIKKNYLKLFTRRHIKVYKYYYNLIAFFGKRKILLATLIILLFGLPLFMMPDKINGEGDFADWYNTTYQSNIRPYSDKILGGALRMFTDDVAENSGYRNPEKTRLYIKAILPYGSTPQQMNDILSTTETFLASIKGIKKYVTNVRTGSFGDVVIEFEEKYENTSLPIVLQQKVIARSLDWGGVEWDIFGVGKGYNNAMAKKMTEYKIRLKGYNYEELEKQAHRLGNKLLSHKRVSKVDIDESLDDIINMGKEFSLNMEDQKLKLSGADISGIVQGLSYQSEAIGYQGQIVVNDNIYPLLIRSKGAQHYSGFDMLNHPVFLDSSKQVRIKEVGALLLQTVSNSIYKQDRQYLRDVSFEYAGPPKFGKQLMDQKIQEMRNEMPIGYEASEADRFWMVQASARDYTLILALLVIIFFVCSILFENLKQSLFIVCTVPISFIGLFLTFALGNIYFDQGGYAAFIMLGGLVSNAAIFIINDYNNLRKLRPHANRNTLLIKAALKRSRTILLVTISSCAGLIPFMIEGQNEVFWFALSAGTTGGMLFSLFAIFILLPSFAFRQTRIV